MSPQIRPILVIPFVCIVVMSVFFIFIAEQSTLFFAVRLDTQKALLRQMIESSVEAAFKDSTEKPWKFKFDASGQSQYWFRLFGAVPNVVCSKIKRTQKTSSDMMREIEGQVETSILFRFSPFVNDHIKSMFPRVITYERWFNASPFQVSCIPRRTRLYCALRIWFRLDRFRKFVNRYQDSFFYGLELDKNLKYIQNSGKMISIPSAIQEIHYTGPEDPRLIMINETILINFINSYNYKEIVRRQFLWSFDKSMLYDLQINGYAQNTFEKNWAPWIVNNTLLFVYQFLPTTRILHCPLLNSHGERLANCSFVAGRPDREATVATGSMLLRGGSPVVHYVGDYYLTITHSVQHTGMGRIYAAQLTLMHGPTARVVFVSSPILLDPSLMNSLEIIDKSLLRPFLYARSIFVEEENSVVVAGGLNDNQCFIVRIRGIANILHEAISNDRQLVADERSQSCEHSLYQERLSTTYSMIESWLRRINSKVLDKLHYIHS